MLNKAILMGRLTADPELRHTPNNIPVTTFTIAVDRRFSKGEDRQTDFIDIVAWRSQAEFVCNYFKKGSMAVVVGAIQVRNWKDQQGNNRRTYEVVAEEISFGESKRNTDRAGGPDFPVRSTGEDGFPEVTNEFKEISGDDELPF